MVERDGLENHCGYYGHRGFESLPLRHCPFCWRGDRVVEGARLEIVCRVTPYRGFESLPLRHFR